MRQRGKRKKSKRRGKGDNEKREVRLRVVRRRQKAAGEQKTLIRPIVGRISKSFIVKIKQFLTTSFEVNKLPALGEKKTARPW